MNAKDIAKPGEFYITVEHLRDRFAMAALTGMLANGTWREEVLCKLSYDYADAMLKARGEVKHE
jgi:hypothetical protein